MKPEDIKLQLQILFEDLADICNEDWMAESKYKQNAHDAYERALNLIDEMYSSITRVSVITTSGRECSHSGSEFKLSLQDDGRTLKLFEVED